MGFPQFPGTKLDILGDLRPSECSKPDPGAELSDAFAPIAEHERVVGTGPPRDHGARSGRGRSRPIRPGARSATRDGEHGVDRLKRSGNVPTSPLRGLLRLIRAPRSALGYSRLSHGHRANFVGIGQNRLLTVPKSPPRSGRSTGRLMLTARDQSFRSAVDQVTRADKSQQLR